MRWLALVAAALPTWPCPLNTATVGEPVSWHACGERLLNSIGTNVWFIPSAPSPRPSQTW